MTTGPNGNRARKIAVLGGGLAAMTAVYELTADPEWKSKYEITIYQMGWRIGGKGASGVNPKIGYRVEEHGLHLWMGFYENAFCMMKKVYDDLGRPPSAPLATFKDAFKGQDYIIFDENIQGQWYNWQINFPKIPGEVGNGVLPGADQLFKMMFEFAGEHYKKWRSTVPGKAIRGCLPPFLQKWIQKNEVVIEKDITNITEKLLEQAEERMLKLSEEDDHSHHLVFFDNLRKWIWDELGNLIDAEPMARHAWLIIDLFTAIISGIISDKVIQKVNGKITLDFTVINQYDYGEWLAMHGADPKLTVPSPLVKGMYDGPFAFLRGDVNQPNAEAGTMLNIFLRLGFTCKENIVWRMQAGMGDTVFAPIYELLTKEKKATFKFFHKVNNLVLSGDKKTVEQIVIGRQVNLKESYYPFVNVNGLDCWPSEPNYKYINDDEAAQLQNENINLESHWTAWEDREIITLQKGIDFDEIIIGASIASLPVIAAELIDANMAWYNMVENVQTVQTQAFQFWMNEDYKTLGTEADTFLTSYVEPLDTFCVMNQLLPRESWPVNNKPKFISYVCGVFPEANLIPPPHEHNFPEKEKERVYQNMLEYITKDLRHIIPGGFDSKNIFKWEYFVDLNNQQGESRLRSQYYRANIDPSERYVLSAAGSSVYRLKTDETGFQNVYITGDWIQNGLNAGFVEGAVTSGLLTALAISGNKTTAVISPSWLLTDYLNRTVIEQKSVHENKT